MAAGGPAATLVVFVALVSAGILLTGAGTEAWRETTDAQVGMLGRVKSQSMAGIELTSDGYASGADRAYANFTNNGSDGIDLDDVDVLVNGSYEPNPAKLEVRGHAGSDVWLPDEVLEVRIDGEGNATITLVGPHGLRETRRPALVPLILGAPLAALGSAAPTSPSTERAVRRRL